MAGLGAFVSGLTHGAQLGVQLTQGAEENKRANERNTRDQERHDAFKKRADLEFQEYESAAPNRGKAIQLQGRMLEHQLLEQGFAERMQGHQQETREIQMRNEQTAARTAGVAGEAAAARQPDELALANQKLLNDVNQGIQQGTALMWDTFRSGNKEAAIKMFNGSSLVLPGQKATDAVLEDAEVPSADGKSKTKTKVLTLKDADGKVLRSSPVAALEALSQRYGAKYEKVGNNLLRIGSDGKVTPLYEADAMMTVPEGGSVVNRRTGAPPATGGVRPSGATPKETARVDDRVKIGTSHINSYFGISDMTGLDAKSQPLYNAIKARMEALVHGGADPVQAGNKAVLEGQGGRLNPDGTPKTGAAAPAAGAKSDGPQLPRLW